MGKFMLQMLGSVSERMKSIFIAQPSILTLRTKQELSQTKLLA
jgi:hypothetical protein